jgi:hypothetical protein
MFHNVKVSYLHANLGIVFHNDNVYINLEVYFELSFVLEEVDNLDAKLEVIYVFFVIIQVRNFFL